MWLSAPNTGHAFPPGEQWAYSSGDINTASLMWQQSLQGEPYPDWIRTHFSEPLAMDEFVLEPDASGVQVGSSYAYLTPRDWARMGQLWLDAWHGRSKVISAAWQRLAVTPGTAKGGEIYGLGFWLNTDHRAFPSAPENTFHAGGNSGQFVVVIPERELVVVRLGSPSMSLEPTWMRCWLMFWRRCKWLRWGWQSYSRKRHTAERGLNRMQPVRAHRSKCVAEPRYGTLFLNRPFA
jgi:CubicO group peptidase (beta-lactamase class C family)